ncbi:hypothetical protein K7432_018486 [Basidiobolus ranarum]|uniref:Fucosyltransferase n=1 Tax=Basidiobolus ranarum TaxID=34480 RepID=A0ABR2WC53_9FUNG
MYNDNVHWEEQTEMCPFPPELQNFFDNYRKLHASEKIVWKTGYAPCWLWTHTEGTNSLNICKNGIKYTLTSNYTEFRDADILYMDYPFYHGLYKAPYWHLELMPPRLAHQRWIFKFGRESIGYYSFVSLASFLQQFDFTLGSPKELFDLSYPLQEISEDYALELAHITPGIPLDAKPTNYIAWMVGNCSPKNNRNEIIQELIEKINGHSYGKCHNNREIPKAIIEKYQSYPADWEWIKNNTLRPYPFSLVVENSNCIGYVTEKIYDALSSGAIPLYQYARLLYH